MHTYSKSNLWFIAFLLLVFAPGCCNPGANPNLAVPIVTSEMPLSASAGLCTTVVTATFSLPMNPTSINGSTFILAGPGATAVSGSVSYDPSNSTATFTPSSALVATTAYTATIMTGAADQDGIALGRVQRAIGHIGDGEGRQALAAIQLQRLLRPESHGLALVGGVNLDGAQEFRGFGHGLILDEG